MTSLYDKGTPLAISKIWSANCSTPSTISSVHWIITLDQTTNHHPAASHPGFETRTQHSKTQVAISGPRSDPAPSILLTPALLVCHGPGRHASSTPGLSDFPRATAWRNISPSHPPGMTLPPVLDQVPLVHSPETHPGLLAPCSGSGYLKPASLKNLCCSLQIRRNTGKAYIRPALCYCPPRWPGGPLPQTEHLQHLEALYWWLCTHRLQAALLESSLSTQSLNFMENQLTSTSIWPGLWHVLQLYQASPPCSTE